ncbi:MAG: hypothetical protein ACAI44_29335 [Candidatus Sericytochromatia bacterium]
MPIFRLRVLLSLSLLVFTSCTPASQPQNPTPVGSASASPSAEPSAGPVATPTPDTSPVASPEPTAGPTNPPVATPTPGSASSTPTPVSSPSASANAAYPGDPAKLVSLEVSPSTFTFSNAGNKTQLLVLAKDINGQFIDPARLNLSWSVSNTDAFSVTSSGLVTALENSGYGTVTVRESSKNLLTNVQVTLGGGGGGGGGGSGGSTAGSTSVNSVVTFEGI